MGDQLDKWIEANSATLQALAGPGQPGVPPAAIPGAQQAFPPGQPEAAGGFPPEMQQASGPPQGSVRGATGAFPPEALAPPGAPQGDVRGVEGPYPPEAFGQPPMPQAAPVDVAGPQPGAAPPAAAPKPKAKKGKGDFGFEDVMKDADPKQIDDAIKVMETASGKSIEELYTAQTGAPPPEGMGKRKLGQALFEFGLNLMSAPAGLSDVESIGRAGQATIAGRRQREEKEEQKALAAEQRAAAAQERALGRMDRKFDRAATLERLALERQRTQAQLDKPVGEFDTYIGEDGYWYRYNPDTDKGNRVMIKGKPFKANDAAITGKQQRFDSEVRQNMFMAVHGFEADGVTPKTGEALQAARIKALDYANRIKPYTRGEANKDAIKLAVPELLKDFNYTSAEPDEKADMKRKLITTYTEMLMSGYNTSEGAPDPSRLTEGVATPITNDSGVTEYWTKKNGEAVRASENQLIR